MAKKPYKSPRRPPPPQAPAVYTPKGGEVSQQDKVALPILGKPRLPIRRALEGAEDDEGEAALLRHVDRPRRQQEQHQLRRADDQVARPFS